MIIILYTLFLSICQEHYILEKHDPIEVRMKVIEDKLAIFELIASHPPSADTGMAEYTSSVYLENSIFDRGPNLDGAQGTDAIAAFILRPEHKEALDSGLSHFAGLPLIDLHQDSAIVTSYLQLIYLDKEGELRELANHGTSSGYRIHRVVINRWELKRVQGDWRILRRTLIPVDGSDLSRKLLSQGLKDILNSKVNK